MGFEDNPVDDVQPTKEEYEAYEAKVSRSAARAWNNLMLCLDGEPDKSELVEELFRIQRDWRNGEYDYEL